MAWNHGLSRAVLRVYTRALRDLQRRDARTRGIAGGQTGMVLERSDADPSSRSEAVSQFTSRAKLFALNCGCGSGSCGRCPSLADYVTGMEPTGGAIAAGMVLAWKIHER